MREVIKEGRDVNEAIDLACAQLGVDRGQINFEIIELPKTSLFGLRKKPAKVRVTVDEPEARKKPAAPKKEPVRAAKPDRPEPKEPPRKEPRREEKPAEPGRTAESTEKPARAEKPRQEAREQERPAKPQDRSEQMPEKQEKPPAEAKVQPVQNVPEPEREPEAPSRFVPMEETEGKTRTACEYVKSVLMEMGVDARLTVAQNDNGIVIRLAGEGLGVVIGRRGETLDSLQYLTGLVANRCEGDYLRVTIDTGNYREKRERTLQQLARKLSASALRSGRSSMLEPMNPYERRIIHSTVSQIEGVTSSSIGEEPNRRVVISPVNAKPRPPRRGAPQGGRRPAPAAGGPGGGRRRYGNEGGERGEFRERQQRRERPEGERPRGEERPTSTAVDREYAKELEREPALAKPEQTAQPEVRERVSREKPKDEAGDLPLYGKIDM